MHDTLVHPGQLTQLVAVARQSVATLDGTDSPSPAARAYALREYRRATQALTDAGRADLAHLLTAERFALASLRVVLDLEPLAGPGSFKADDLTDAIAAAHDIRSKITAGLAA